MLELKHSRGHLNLVNDTVAWRKINQDKAGLRGRSSSSKLLVTFVRLRIVPLVGEEGGLCFFYELRYRRVYYN